MAYTETLLADAATGDLTAPLAAAVITIAAGFGYIMWLLTKNKD